MRWNRLLVLLSVSPLIGCTMVSQAVHNIQYDHALREDLKERSAIHRQMAMDAWMEVWVASGEQAPEAGFSDGFIDGFTDYLDRGGLTESPPVPPQRFWHADYLNPAGRHVAERYLQGFARGAAAAKASGQRKNSVVLVMPPTVYTEIPPAPLPPPIEEPRIPLLPPPIGDPRPPAPPPSKKDTSPRPASGVDTGPSPRPVVTIPYPEEPVPVGFQIKSR